MELLQPILEYQASKTSPPLAPKHITAASSRPRKPRESRALGSSPVEPPKAKRMRMKKGVSAQILPRPLGATVGVADENTGEYGESVVIVGSENDDVTDDDLTSTSTDDGEGNGRGLSRMWHTETGMIQRNL